MYPAMFTEGRFQIDFSTLKPGQTPRGGGGEFTFAKENS